MIRHTLKILQQMQDHVSDHFGTLCSKGLNRAEIPKLTKEQSQNCEAEINEGDLLKAVNKSLRISCLETTE